jgi:hypothetical protein
MKILLLCCVAAVATTGCTISTELDPNGSPKYRATVRGTGTNIVKRFDAIDMPSTKTMAGDDVERLLRTGGNRTPAGTH